MPLPACYHWQGITHYLSTTNRSIIREGCGVSLMWWPVWWHLWLAVSMLVNSLNRYLLLRNWESPDRHTNRISRSAPSLQQYLGRAIATQPCLNGRGGCFSTVACTCGPQSCLARLVAPLFNTGRKRRHQCLSSTLSYLTRVYAWNADITDNYSPQRNL